MKDDAEGGDVEGQHDRFKTAVGLKLMYRLNSSCCAPHDRGHMADG